jgi:hypothetical protein
MPKITEIKIYWEEDNLCSLSHLDPEPDDTDEDRKQKAAELEKYIDGEAWHVGCWAEATVEHGGQLQQLRSAGLWGIEHDAPQAYCEEIAREQLNELKEQLNIYCVTTVDFEEHIKELALTC